MAEQLLDPLQLVVSVLANGYLQRIAPGRQRLQSRRGASVAGCCGR